MGENWGAKVKETQGLFKKAAQKTKETIMFYTTIFLIMNIIYCGNNDISAIWDNPNTDVAFSTVVLQNVWNDSIIYKVEIGDTTCIINMRPFGNQTYRLGVSLTDSAGNESTVLWSDSDSNKSGKFLLCKDTVIPLKPGYVKAGKL